MTNYCFQRLLHCVHRYTF